MAKHKSDNETENTDDGTGIRGVDLMTLESVRDLIASRDDNSRARIHAKAAEIRAIALSDEEGRLALYLVHAEGSV